jgi:hypothetical protein
MKAAEQPSKSIKNTQIHTDDPYKENNPQICNINGNAKKE